MKIKIVGKTTATVGNTNLKIKTGSRNTYVFSKVPGEGYIYDCKDSAEAQDIFNSQNQRFAYYFSPVFSEGKEDTPKVEIDTKDLSLDELKSLCDKLGIKTLPQDKERAMTRMLEAYKLGASS